jgi:hypothetical protein
MLVLIMIMASTTSTTCTTETGLQRINEHRATHHVMSIFSTEAATSVQSGFICINEAG